MKFLFGKLEQALISGNNIILCSIIESKGSTPRGAGAKMIVFEDGTIVGTIGGGAIEHYAILHAIDLCKKKTHDIKSYCLAPNEAADIGMVCGGSVTVCFKYIQSTSKNIEIIKHINSLFAKGDNAWFILNLSNSSDIGIATFDKTNNLMYSDFIDNSELMPLLKNKPICVKDKYYIEPFIQSGYVYIFGGGHVSQELTPLLAHIGFRPIIFEDRDAFARKELFPDAEKIILGNFSAPGEKIKVNSEDYIVILTRGHQGDYEVLRYAMTSPATYIGLIGSKSKLAKTLEKLENDGISKDTFSRIHNPIGLPIKAETPAEIAISIAAEMILHRADNNK